MSRIVEVQCATTQKDGVSSRTMLHLDLSLPSGRNAGGLSKRDEMLGIGLVLLLHHYDPDLALFVTTKLSLDPEKYNAILGLMGCTQEEIEEDDKQQTKDAFKKALSGSADALGIIE